MSALCQQFVKHPSAVFARLAAIRQGELRLARTLQTLRQIPGLCVPFGLAAT